MLTRRAILAALFAAPAVRLLPGPVATDYRAFMDDAWARMLANAGPDAAARDATAVLAIRMAQSLIHTAAEVRACLPTDRRATHEEMLAAHDAALRGHERMLGIVGEHAGAKP